MRKLLLTTAIALAIPVSANASCMLIGGAIWSCSPPPIQPPSETYVYVQPQVTVVPVPVPVRPVYQAPLRPGYSTSGYCYNLDLC